VHTFLVDHAWTLSPVSKLSNAEQLSRPFSPPVLGDLDRILAQAENPDPVTTASGISPGTKKPQPATGR
jgi:hypothetical protein